MTNVVITGVGVVSSIGQDFDAFAQALKAGQPGIAALRLHHEDWHIDGIGARVDDDLFLPRLHQIGKIRSLDRTANLALVAADEAIKRGGFDIDGDDLCDAGVVVGTSVGSWETLEQSFSKVFSKASARLRPDSIPKLMPNSACSMISMTYGMRGPAFTVSTACASSTHAISLAHLLIKSGQADLVLVGGAEAPLTYSSFKAWSALRIIAADTCRPFSVDRKGVVLGEGAAMLVLESAEHAAQRGAEPLAEIMGVGMNADAGDIVQPSVEGVREAMLRALRDAKVAPNDMDYINAHGTGTRVNDIVESQVLKEIFDLPNAKTSLSSTKAMHGHCLGAAGALEMVATLAAMRDGFVPPTINHLGADPECGVDATPNEARDKDVRIAMSCSFAFGGLNAAVVLKKPG